MAPSCRNFHTGQTWAPFFSETTLACIWVSAVAPRLSLSDTLPHPIADYGPGLMNGIANVDDASFATRIKVHSGPPAPSRDGLVALLDTGSPQTFISAED